MVWLAPSTLDEAVRLRAERPDATVVAGGTFVGVLARQGLLRGSDWLSLQRLDELRAFAPSPHDDELAIGAMVTHRIVELDPVVGRSWSGLSHVFSVVASRRVRTVATVGGVLADADYASDPPAMLVALDAWVEARSVRGSRRIDVADLIVGHYETSLAPDELIVRVVVPRRADHAVYRKLRTRSHEDRPAVAVAAARTGGATRVVVGAVSDRPRHFPDLCALWNAGDPHGAAAVASGYAERIDPVDDARGSSDYRRHCVAVEVRRALLDLARLEGK